MIKTITGSKAVYIFDTEEFENDLEKAQDFIMCLRTPFYVEDAQGKKYVCHNFKNIIIHIQIEGEFIPFEIPEKSEKEE